MYTKDPFQDILIECNQIESLLTQANNCANASANTIAAISSARTNLIAIQESITLLVYQNALNIITIEANT